ncbi:MAG TPA: M14 family zinc carboxypeptidase [Actinomycetota bacterium]
MTRRLLALALSLTAISPLTGLVPYAQAGPVKCAESEPTVDGRVFSEPRASVTFLRFDEFRCGVELLQWLHRDLIDIEVVGMSRGYLPVLDVRLTDETVGGEKEDLLVVSSIHGDEQGGREGAARVIEDMVDPDLLGNQAWVKQVLDEFVIHFLFPNPDGWVNGDLVGSPGAGTGSTRGNDSGRDLNRQFPVTGYIYTPNATAQEPETPAIQSLLASEEDWYLGTDNHGQGADTYAAAGLQIVGQFDYQKSETLARFADGIDDEMATYGVLQQLQQLKDATGQDLGPYHWGTLYDMLGYSASGSLIDYYNTVRPPNGTSADGTAGWGFATELTVGSEENAAAYPALLNQVWVDSIRAINYTMFKQAIDRKDYTYQVGGKAAYVFDPDVITDADANGAGYVRKTGEDLPQAPYAVTRMKFFEDLNRYADRPLDAVRVGDLLRDPSDERFVDLYAYDSLVLANDAAPEAVDEGAYFGLLRRWVEDGGNLVVTDAAAAEALPALGIVGPTDVSMIKRYVGYVDFGDRGHPLNANLRGVARQTYDSVPIGYAFPPAGNNCPNWRVSAAAWEAAGGYTAGTNDASYTAYGQLPVQDGMVRFIGSLLPDPTEDFYHPFGLQNYAVTYTGYTLLQNSLNWDNPARA